MKELVHQHPQKPEKPEALQTSPFKSKEEIMRYCIQGGMPQGATLQVNGSVIWESTNPKWEQSREELEKQLENQKIENAKIIRSTPQQVFITIFNTLCYEDYEFTQLALAQLNMVSPRKLMPQDVEQNGIQSKAIIEMAQAYGIRESCQVICSLAWMQHTGELQILNNQTAGPKTVLLA